MSQKPYYVVALELLLDKCRVPSSATVVPHKKGRLSFWIHDLSIPGSCLQHHPYGRIFIFTFVKWGIATLKLPVPSLQPITYGVKAVTPPPTPPVAVWGGPYWPHPSPTPPIPLVTRPGGKFGEMSGCGWGGGGGKGRGWDVINFKVSTTSHLCIQVHRALCLVANMGIFLYILQYRDTSG